LVSPVHVDVDVAEGEVAAVGGSLDVGGVVDDPGVGVDSGGGGWVPVVGAVGAVAAGTALVAAGAAHAADACSSAPVPEACSSGGDEGGSSPASAPAPEGAPAADGALNYPTLLGPAPAGAEIVDSSYRISSTPAPPWAAPVVPNDSFWVHVRKNGANMVGAIGDGVQAGGELILETNEEAVKGAGMALLVVGAAALTVAGLSPAGAQEATTGDPGTGESYRDEGTPMSVDLEMHEEWVASGSPDLDTSGNIYEVDAEAIRNSGAEPTSDVSNNPTLDLATEVPEGAGDAAPAEGVSGEQQPSVIEETYSSQDG